MAPEERAREGIFLAFQYPVEIPGVSNTYFLHAALNAIRKHRGERRARRHRLPRAWSREKAEAARDGRRAARTAPSTRASPAARRSATRSSRWPCSSPTLAILDETDSGLDIDALQDRRRRRQRAARPGARHHRHHPLPAPARLHRARPRPRARPTGRIVQSGGKELALELEEKGYALARRPRPARRRRKPERRRSRRTHAMTDHRLGAHDHLARLPTATRRGRPACATARSTRFAARRASRPRATRSGGTPTSRRSRDTAFGAGLAPRRPTRPAADRALPHRRSLARHSRQRRAFLDRPPVRPGARSLPAQAGERLPPSAARRRRRHARATSAPAAIIDAPRSRAQHRLPRRRRCSSDVAATRRRRSADPARSTCRGARPRSRRVGPPARYLIVVEERRAA